jgi:hypothetical protein
MSHTELLPTPLEESPENHTPPVPDPFLVQLIRVLEQEREARDANPSGAPLPQHDEHHTSTHVNTQISRSRPDTVRFNRD